MTAPVHENPPVVTVGQLTQAIKFHLETSFPLVWVQGEISNFKQQTSGHLYFSLKDAQAQVSAVMFRADAATLRQLPKEGDQVIVKASLNVYPQKGNYQLVVKELNLVGLGDLLLKLDELKRKLLKKGWFAKEYKKPIPKFPKIIGVVTSPTGAVIQDILNVLSRRFSGFHLILNPVKVQGEGAAQEIAKAIEEFNRYDMVDVMIVGRGGGSIEDLWAFNEEIVAEAIFNSKIPIISAVGHETDHCIADYVADVRAPTPSAAAEIVIAEKAHQLQHLTQVQQRLKHTMMHVLKQYRHKLSGIVKQPIFMSPYALLGNWMQKSDDLKVDIQLAMKQLLKQKKMKLESYHRQAEALKPTTQILHWRQKLLYWDKGLKAHIQQKIGQLKADLRQKDSQLNQAWRSNQEKRKKVFNPPALYRTLDQIWVRSNKMHKERLKKLSDSLHSIDPKNLLKKGYTILFSGKDGSVISTVSDLEPELDLRLMLADGEATAKVNEIFPKPQ